MFKKKLRRSKSSWLLQRVAFLVSFTIKHMKTFSYWKTSWISRSLYTFKKCDFHRGFNAQQCLLVMLEKFSKELDKAGHYAAILTDLSKWFDCISHDLISPKLHTYGFDIPSLKLMNSYLTIRLQRIKLNNSYSL